MSLVIFRSWIFHYSSYLVMAFSVSLSKERICKFHFAIYIYIILFPRTQNNKWLHDGKLNYAKSFGPKGNSYTNKKPTKFHEHCRRFTVGLNRACVHTGSKKKKRVTLHVVCLNNARISISNETLLIRGMYSCSIQLVKANKNTPLPHVS